jgi:hypothetical protein
MTNAEATTAEGIAAVTPQGATVAPGTAKATTKTSQKKAAPKAKTGAKPAAATAPAPKASQARRQGPEAGGAGRSKKSAVVELLRRKEGATAAEIAKVTKWQAHSIRGFISGTISNKMKPAVESFRNEQGERVYRVK